MRRLYLLIPDVESCRAIVDELRAEGVASSHLHVVASLSSHLEGLPEATAWQKTELAHGIWIGILLGGVAGLLASLLAVTIPPPGIEIGATAVLASTVAGAAFGALASACPLLLVIEDLHWGDLPSVNLIDGALRAHTERLVHVDVEGADLDELAELTTKVADFGVTDLIIDSGARGLAPENSLPAFLLALELFAPDRSQAGVHPTAVIADDVRIPAGTGVGPVVERSSAIASRTTARRSRPS